MFRESIFCRISNQNRYTSFQFSLILCMRVAIVYILAYIILVSLRSREFEEQSSQPLFQLRRLAEESPHLRRCK